MLFYFILTLLKNLKIARYNDFLCQCALDNLRYAIEIESDFNGVTPITANREIVVNNDFIRNKTTNEDGGRKECLKNATTCYFMTTTLLRCLFFSYDG